VLDHARDGSRPACTQRPVIRTGDPVWTAVARCLRRRFDRWTPPVLPHTLQAGSLPNREEDERNEGMWRRDGWERSRWGNRGQLTPCGLRGADVVPRNRAVTAS
jgi:hypothetical protein